MADDGFLGFVAVDSGRVIIGDPCNLTDDNGANMIQGVYRPVKGDLGIGVISGSGYGDGAYPVFADYGADGQVVSLTVYFGQPTR